MALATDAALTFSIRIPTLKFLGLTVPKIWHILCVCVSWSATTISDLQTGAQCSTCHGVPSCQFWWYYDYSFSIYGPLGQHGSDWSRDVRDLDIWPWRSRRLWLMRVVVLHPYTKFEVRRPWHSEEMAHDVCQHRGDLDTNTLKLVYESHLQWVTFLPNLGMLGLWVLELFAMYATDGQTETDGRTKATLLAPSLRAGE